MAESIRSISSIGRRVRVFVGIILLVVGAVSGTPGLGDERAAAQEPAAQSAPRDFLAEAEQAFRQGRFHESIQLYGLAEKTAPGVSAVYLGKGMAYEALNEDGKAIAAYEKALAIDPGDYRSMENLGAVYERQGTRMQEAAALYRKAQKLDPRTEWQENLSVWAAMLESRSRPEDTHAVGCWHLGNARMEKGDAEAAESYYSKAVELDPLMFQAYHSRGLIRLKKGKLKEALADFEQTVQLAPTLPDGFLHRGLALELLGNRAEARQDVEQALKMAPKDPRALYHHARMTDDEGDFESARRFYDEALRRRPTPDLSSLIRERLSGLGSSKRRRGADAQPRQPEGKTWW
ncbi:MAG: tetratricopeptide repeat protein [Desulfomonile tiedjei]|nr:tetratricopeptide repeat protein [Desulfomonile tiedjei]